MLPLVLFVVGVAGCSPYAKYRDVQLTVGMNVADIKQHFGEPDSYNDRWNKYPQASVDYGSDHSNKQSSEHTHHVEELGYGPFGAHSQKVGHVTKYRLSMTFVDGRLQKWVKSAPSNSE